LVKAKLTDAQEDLDLNVKVLCACLKKKLFVKAKIMTTGEIVDNILTIDGLVSPEECDKENDAKWLKIEEE
jgi:hypothetical protein